MPLATPTMIIFMGGPYTTLNHAPVMIGFALGCPHCCMYPFFIIFSFTPIVRLTHIPFIPSIIIVVHFILSIQSISGNWRCIDAFYLSILLILRIHSINSIHSIHSIHFIHSIHSINSIHSIHSISIKFYPSVLPFLHHSPLHDSRKTPAPCSAESNESSKAPLGYQALQRTQGGKFGRILCLIETLLI